mmetsp:Transcript_90549/g.157087  ORF Transcript_90549/g.157087 Transcript_90549/m.157087 type:complete len:845 (-) Transcript_90549:53-2587(-)
MTSEQVSENLAPALPVGQVNAGPLMEPAIQEAIHCAMSLAQGGDADEALAVLRCECVGAPAASMGMAYAAVTEAYLQSDRLESAFTTLTEMQQLGEGKCQVPAACQEAVLRAAVQAQQHARAAQLLRSMCATGAVPGDALFNSVVDIAIRARAYGDAWEALALLLAHRRRADKYFVSILTKSLETSRDRKWIRRGLDLVDRFVEQQREDVDEIVFNSLLNVLGSNGDMAKLQQALNKMDEYGVPPSAVTYGTVVKAYGKAGDIEAVIKAWKEMRTRCLGVNPVTCGCVLDACVKCGHLDKAMTIFQEMRLAGLHKNTVLYATLIKGLAKVRDLNSAVQLYQEMRMEGVACNLVTFNSLMDVCVRCGNLHTAALFLQDMMQMGIDPDLITFSTLIKGYSHMGEVHKALALSRELKLRGLKCDEIMYNSLIDGCAKAGKLQEGLLVFEEMQQAKVAPSNITFSILVKLHFEAGLAEQAFTLLQEMPFKYHCVPNRIVYTALLRCCAQHGGAALGRGVSLLCELSTKKNSKVLDQGMVSAVISGCVQHAEWELATRTAKELASGAARRGSSLIPQDAMRYLFEALGEHDESRGQDLLDFLRKKAVPAGDIAQLQAALAEGRRRAATAAPAQTAGPLPPSNVPAMDASAVWPQPGATPWPQQVPGQFPPQPYSNDFYHPYQELGYAEQMGYYNGFAQLAYPGVGVPTMPAQAPAIHPGFLPPAATMPAPAPPVAVFTGAATMPPVAAPQPIPAAPQPMVGSPGPMALAALGATQANRAPPLQALGVLQSAEKPVEKAVEKHGNNSRRSPVDKENAGPTGQRPAGKRQGKRQQGSAVKANAFTGQQQAM